VLLRRTEAEGGGRRHDQGHHLHQNLIALIFEFLYFYLFEFSCVQKHAKGMA